MLRRIDTLVSEDFPEFEVEIRRPRTDDWSEFQTACVDGNVLDGMFNLTIAVGTVYRVGADGKRIDGAQVPRIGDLVDEWSTLPEYAAGTAGLLCGVFGEGVNATRLDLPAILAAADRVAAWQKATAALTPEEQAPSSPPAADLELAKLAERCAQFWLTAEVMRTVIANHPRRGSYAAFLVDDVGAFVFERPRFPAWAAFDRRSKRERFAACLDLVTTCTAFPDRGAMYAIVSDLPGFVTTAADEIKKLRQDVRTDVKKG